MLLTRRERKPQDIGPSGKATTFSTYRATEGAISEELLLQFGPVAH
jgi:hypothetical protein